MDVAGGLSLVQSLIGTLGSPFLTEIESVLGFKSQLQKLKDTMSTIEAILLDAEKNERRHQYRFDHVESMKLEMLRKALYDADDLFDEVTTLAHRKQLMPGNKLSKEVCLFFSCSNQFCSAFNWSREINNIRQMLDDNVKNHHLESGLKHTVGLVESGVRNNPRETHSFVSETENVIVGRDDDKRIVIDILLDTTVEDNVSLISIVGIGGLGKTTLAKLVYNDEMILKEFPLKMWVCVSDDFNVKALVGEILALVSPEIKQDELKMDQLQMNLRQQLDGKKYLLVLDDVWNQDCEKWLDLKTLLIGGGRGSRIIVTTRSSGVATAVGSKQIHKLEGLSEKESWNLFKRMTLEPGQHQMKAHLVHIGKEIVRKCANVPLAIRVIGSLLRGQGESRWLYMRDTDLANIKQDENTGILPVLKISYYDLPSHLKSCFSYCAIFPKDYKIIKEDLISLWMAQGFVMPSHGQSFEDVGDEYFMGLLQRCFFQDVEVTESGEIISCKMHDLIHDVATEVAGTEIVSYNNVRRCFNEKTRHIYIDINDNAELSDFTKMKRMRTLLSSKSPSPDVLSKLGYLRVLGLQDAGLITLPKEIGNLLHLRYVDLSDNAFSSVLPSSITKLCNLQTLKLRSCHDLKSLPRGLSKLVNLRHLDIQGCSGLTHMPPGMNKMTSLHKLTGFVLGGRGNSWNWGSDSVGEIQDLNSFTNHSDTMEVYVKKGVRYDAAKAREGSFLFKSQHLREIRYEWYDTDSIAEALLQGLQPHSNLRKFNLFRYPGAGFPRWGESNMNFQSFLPNLVEIELRGCTLLEHIPIMSQLRHLKVLSIIGCYELEYVESSDVSGEGASTASTSSASTSSRQQFGADDDFVFFPSLEMLLLYDLPKLKGWWKGSLEAGNDETKETGFQSYYSYSFHHLSHLIISRCLNLTSLPLCPKLEELELFKCSEALRPIKRESNDSMSSSISGMYPPKDDSPSTSESNNKQKQGQQRHFREVYIDDVGYLNSMPIECFQHLSNLVFHMGKTERLTIGEVGEVFRSGRLSSLRSLKINCCGMLKSISGQGVWEHFTALETLQLVWLNQLEMEDEEEVNNIKTSGCTAEGDEEDVESTDTDMPWRYLSPTLRNLELSFLRKLEKLPKGMQHLTALHSLSISNCDNLESLPPWIGCLSSLLSLKIVSCERIKSLPKEMGNLTSLSTLHLEYSHPELKKRCKEQTGTDWPQIKHIPHIII